MATRSKLDKNSKLGLIFWMLCLYFAFEYARPQDLLPALAPLRIPLMMTLLLPVLWLAKGDKQVLKDPLIILYGVFIVLCAATVTWAHNQYWVSQVTQWMVAMLIAGTLPAAGFLQDRRRLSAFFTVWVGIHMIVTYTSLTNEGQGAGSFLGDENDMALAINMAIPYAYFLMQSVDRGKVFKGIMAVAILAMVAAIVLSDSRGGLVGLLAVTGGIILFSKNLLRNALFVAFFGVIALVNLPDGYVDEMSTITDENDPTRGERIYSWGLGWKMFLDYPLAGVGAGNYPWRVAEYEARHGEYTGRRSLGGRVSHSLYFTLIPELGMAGIALFGSMTWIMYRRLRDIIKREDRRAEELSGKKGWKAPPTEVGLLARAMLVSMLGLFSSGAFISVLYYPHFWFLLGFVVAMHYATLPEAERQRASVRQRAGAAKQALRPAAARSSLS